MQRVQVPCHVCSSDLPKHRPRADGLPIQARSGEHYTATGRFGSKPACRLHLFPRFIDHGRRQIRGTQLGASQGFDVQANPRRSITVRIASSRVLRYNSHRAWIEACRPSWRSRIDTIRSPNLFSVLPGRSRITNGRWFIAARTKGTEKCQMFMLFLPPQLKRCEGKQKNW